MVSVLVVTVAAADVVVVMIVGATVDPVAVEVVHVQASHSAGHRNRI